MEIEILQLKEGAKKATGTTIIIDVFRAFSLEAYLFAQGCKEVRAVYDKQQAYAFKKEHPEYILIGERQGKILPGFDYGNAPSSITGKDFSGKTVIHTTTNGTLGIQNASHAADIHVASLVNAKATVEVIKAHHPEHVSIVCMGWEDRETEEDTLCAQYMRHLFLDEDVKDIQTKADALRYSEGKKFFDPLQQDVFPKEDFALCTDVDRFDFAIHAEMHGRIAYNRKEYLHA